MVRPPRWLPLVLVTGMAVTALATTWGSKDITCPVCGKSTEMETIASYGSYIYNWPSKYQLVFWPDTTGRALYFCPHCHFAMLMGDYQKLPTDKVEAVKEAIAPLQAKQPAGRYFEVSMPYRLKLAEAAYRVAGRDDSFWCRFYRIMGYHFDKAGRADEARGYRQKALELARKMLKEGVDDPPEKEIVLIVGSMQYFTGQKEAAQATLALVPETPIRATAQIPAEHVKNATEYLDKLAKSLLNLIQAGSEVPQ